MQGKERKQHMDTEEQLVDKAWANMSDLLDQEMPVINPVAKSNSKKYLTLLLLLFIGFLLGVGAMKFFQKEEVPKTEPFRSDIPIATIQNQKQGIEKEVIVSNNSQLTDRKIATTDTNKKTIDNRENSLIANRDLSIERTKSVHETTQIIASTPILKTTLFENKSTKKESVVTAQIVDIEPVVTINNTGGNSSIQRTNKVVKSDRLAFVEDKLIVEKEEEKFKQLTNSIASIDLPTATLEELTQKERGLGAALVLPKKSRLKVGAIAGTHLGSNGYAGWEAGGLIEHQLNRKFAIQTGLTLKSLKKDVAFSQSIAEGSTYLDQDLNDPIGSNGLIPGSGSNGNTDPTIVSSQEVLDRSSDYDLNLNYLNTPLLLSYQPVSYFKLLLGVNMAYRLNFLNNNGGLFDDASRDLMTNADASFSNKSSIINQGIRKIDLSTIFGIGFYPNEKFGIDLRYNHGLQDITNDDVFNNGRNHHNRSTQLSLLYFFGD